jgi:hypothetical protein
VKVIGNLDGGIIVRCAADEIREETPLNALAK